MKCTARADEPADTSEEEEEAEKGSGVRHGKSLSPQTESACLTAAPRQRLVWGWHAAVAGCVGVTSAPGPEDLKARGCRSGEEGHMRALTHCGNRAARAIWGPSDGEAYLETLTESAPWVQWKGRRNPPTLTRSPLSSRFVFFVSASLSFALNEVAALFLCQPQAMTALHPPCQRVPCQTHVLIVLFHQKKMSTTTPCPFPQHSPVIPSLF